ncbi:hypothetical protein C0V75_17940 [Tabrizicola sp. TH137]|uniref:transglutaminase-like cysteine peptidase n=1 Tax=Tabrizicola sp. TH137 TaxID=2067452 RepID=UPI000C798228|nr:transglutaminase-like cysteine peptidase [Tabrizicola sp. TH137]PLL11161.1 hypothetical protein C0V75_17940 [Tabrizicola sp. TH137]
MRPILTLIAAAATLLSFTGPALAIEAVGKDAFLPVQQAAPAPPGAAGLCRDYDWACARGPLTPAGADVLKIAAQVNSAANAAIRPISDQRQFAVVEHWSLPTARGGDCEDYALYKKRALVAQGIAPNRLLIAVVLDRKRQPHAVLVLRSDLGDFVLDNMTRRVLPWQKTGYAFLRMQDPKNPARWVSVLVQAGADLSS